LDQLKIIFLFWSNGIKYTHHLYKFRNCIYLYRNFFPQKYREFLFLEKIKNIFSEKIFELFSRKNIRNFFSEKILKYYLSEIKTLFRKNFSKKIGIFFWKKLQNYFYLNSKLFSVKKSRTSFPIIFFAKKDRIFYSKKTPELFLFKLEIFFREKIRTSFPNKISETFFRKNCEIETFFPKKLIFFSKKDRKFFSRKDQKKIPKKIQNCF
jgi:hypothetical protein